MTIRHRRCCWRWSFFEPERNFLDAFQFFIKENKVENLKPWLILVCNKAFLSTSFNFLNCEIKMPRITLFLLDHEIKKPRSTLFLLDHEIKMSRNAIFDKKTTKNMQSMFLYTYSSYQLFFRSGIWASCQRGSWAKH